MKIDWQAARKSGWLAGFLAAALLIWTYRDEALAIGNSDDPPLAGKAQLEQVAQATLELSRSVQSLAGQVSQMARAADSAALQGLLDQRRDLEIRLRAQPTDSLLRRLLAETEARIADIQARLNAPELRR